MDQQFTSNLPPFSQDNVEQQYADEIEEEDQTETIQIPMSQMKDILLASGKKNGKTRQSVSFTPRASPSEQTLPVPVGPEESLSSPTPGPKAISTPETEQIPQTHQRRELFSTPTNPSPLQKQLQRQERKIGKSKAKNYKLNFNGEEVEKFIGQVKMISQIEQAREEYLAIQM
ncbi:hypothetical protein O181_092178 [Austropuccinia psidii MF-1]|uniref:Uncharacterized protein n=1 Tax=Austropuccinia psidii MF-1 TaxID=1389203 RepID=A0A9Q3IYS1_9BASI|nr:hypothetical protein [Austropuccinia psidii MF-1]